MNSLNNNHSIAKAINFYVEEKMPFLKEGYPYTYLKRMGPDVDLKPWRPLLNWMICEVIYFIELGPLSDKITLLDGMRTVSGIDFKTFKLPKVSADLVAKSEEYAFLMACYEVLPREYPDSRWQHPDYPLKTQLDALIEWAHLPTPQFRAGVADELWSVGVRVTSMEAVKKSLLNAILSAKNLPTLEEAYLKYPSFKRGVREASR